MIPSKTKLALLGLVLVIALPAVAYLLLSSSIHDMPSYTTVKAHFTPSEAWLLDRNGEVIAVKRMDDKARRLNWLKLSDISPAMQEILVMSEDQRFFRHSGVDWLAIAAAAGSNIRHSLDGKRLRGASTISMQLAGFLDPALAPDGNSRSLRQKWRQIAAAMAIERKWSKREILEAYLNLASFRGEIVGIHAATFALFGQHPSALNRPQSLLLAALLKGPQSRPGQVANRACTIVKQSSSERDPTCAELRALASITLSRPNYYLPQNTIAPHLAQKLLNQPGSRITTTIDAKLQRYTIEAMREHLRALDGRNTNDAAVVVIDNASGDVLAYVGSSGALSEAADVDGTMALRQAGSTLKPFLYGMAIEEKRLTAASILEDSPLQLITPTGLYAPQDYDRDFKGTVSTRTALASSLNVPAVRTLGLVGVNRFVRKLQNLGLDNLTQDGDYYGYGLALGGAEVRLIQLSNAYRAIANRGIWRPLRFQFTAHPGKTHRVMSREAAFIIADILSDKGARTLAFGLDNPLATHVWSAAKTGTSKDMRDNWCIGFSSRYTVGVWVGNFTGSSMWDVSGVSGAAPIWHDVIEYLHAYRKSEHPAAPENVLTQKIHFIPEIESPRNEWFVKGTETDEIRLVSQNGSADQAPKILYPANGEIIAIDPDIPVRHQRVQFDSHGGDELTWVLDETPLGKGRSLWWSPTGGHHKLTLTDPQGKELDAITFEVRGSVATNQASN